MTRLNIELPEDVRDKLAARAAESGHSDVEAYVTALLTAEVNTPTGPARLLINSDEELEQLLLSRIDDEEGDIEATPEFWRQFDEETELRRRKGK